MAVIIWVDGLIACMRSLSSPDLLRLIYIYIGGRLKAARWYQKKNIKIGLQKLKREDGMEMNR